MFSKIQNLEVPTPNIKNIKICLILEASFLKISKKPKYKKISSLTPLLTPQFIKKIKIFHFYHGKNEIEKLFSSFFIHQA